MLPLQEGDEGLYRCRVDFKKARTRNYQVQLNVILPPNEPIITDQNGEILPTKSVIGPYNEGDKLVLICQVDGGNPPPMVTWWRESFLLDNNFNISNGISKNVLEVPALTRNDLMATFTCMASNNNISFPVSASVIIDLNYIPILNLRLGSKLRHQHIQEGNDVFFECDIRANPWVSDIGWRFEGKEVQSNTSAGVIVSNQSLVLQKVDLRNRGRYTCTATNIQGIGESNVVMLKVRCKWTC
ncbi:protein turtleB-like [Tropilaelaps mercedesae]|uniref:Protein turtleB-like n=1 Tax=Tropilaelaps mercedesae TaxID=418985 RepID=A0A1V9XUS1_9ACAR|nr:protein turtleB-like [Tropilaelaps mercedesae]